MLGRPAFTPTDDQAALIASVGAFLADELEVEAAWLSGSLGKGQGDAYSDIDVLVLVAPGAAPAVSARIAGKLPVVARAVLVNSLFGGRVLNVVTEDWARFDLSFTEGDEIVRFDASALKPLFNRGARTPSAQEMRPYAPSPEGLTRMVEEFLRVLGLAVVGAGRREYVLMMWGVELLCRMTMDLMLEENRIAPAARGGALCRNPFLTEEQRSLLEGAPPLAATRNSVMEANRYFAGIFLPRARRLAADIGAAWPEAFEAATRRHLESKIGLRLLQADPA